MNIKQTSKKVTKEENRQIMLEIMDEIDEFCSQNGLTYFLVGGTLLGAIRHKGFIPWDDDMDIGLPRKDYNKLISDFKSKSGNIEIKDYHTDSNYKWASAKASDKRTLLIELGDKKHTTGVFVDVFPFDGVPGDKKKALHETIKRKRWKDLLTLKHLKIEKDRSISKNLLVVAGKILFFIPDKFIIGKINIFEKEPIGFEQCDYVCNFTGAWGIKELTVSSNFRETVTCDFEGRHYKIPIGYDDYLKTVYGDYMTPPPKEKQISHHSSEAFWR